MVLILFISLLGCSSTNGTKESNNSNNDSSEIIVFSDEALEGLIRIAMNKPAGHNGRRGCGSNTTDYSALAEIYPNLEEKDFDLN